MRGIYNSLVKITYLRNKRVSQMEGNWYIGEKKEKKRYDVEGNLFAAGVFILENVTASLLSTRYLSEFLLTEINWIRSRWLANAAI